MRIVDGIVGTKDVLCSAKFASLALRIGASIQLSLMDLPPCLGPRLSTPWETPMRTYTNHKSMLLSGRASQSRKHCIHPLNDITGLRLRLAIATSTSVHVLPLTIYVTRIP